jgi:DNA sulfur modification protein DndD
MLRLERVEIEDFGPYKGLQEFHLPPGNGVTVVYGENRRGKTSLLNAIRYAFLGVVITRGSRPLDFHKVVNLEARQEGREGFRVFLEFQFEARKYALTRMCRPRPGVVDPTSNEHYVNSIYLQREGQPLSAEEAIHELARIMPPQISRFFLFDGELLAEYEELLRDREESDIGGRIASAIEQILGLPVLQNARAHLAELTQEAVRDEARAAQKDIKTRELGTLIETLGVQIEAHRRTHSELEQQLEVGEAKKLALDEILRKTAGLEALLDERDRLEREIEELEARRDERINRLQEALGSAWRGLLARRLKPMKEELLRRRDEFQEHLTLHLLSAKKEENLADARKTGRCPVCNQQADPNLLQGQLATSTTQTTVTVEEVQRQLVDLQQKIDVVSSLGNSADATGALRLFDDLEEIRIDLHDREERLRDLVEEIGGPVENYDTHRKEYEQLVGELQLLRNGLAAEEEATVQKEGRLKELQRKVDQVAGSGLDAERNKRELLGSLSQLFRESVDLYRDRLRQRVEEDATDLFLRLTTEPQDKGLRINEQYGLTIVHEDGSDVPVRSSGAEQIVALSLMGALQKNAPLKGPLIMDALLFRIDDEHRANVVRALPDMADQVVVLVFRAELSPEAARERLHGSLLAEYELRRMSARHTDIERFRGTR